MDKNIIIKLENINVIVNNKAILNNITFNIKSGEIITIVGKNGAGKSSLCKLLSGNLVPSVGKISKQKDLKISYAPQIHDINFYIPLKVIDYIKLNNKASVKNITELIKTFELSNLAQQMLSSLSGGELQKVMICRSILLNPDLIILDEPTSFADYESKSNIYNIILDLQKQKKFALVVVSHDPNLVLKNSSWVLCLHNGHIGCQGNIIDIHNTTHFIKIFGNNWKLYNHKDETHD